MQRRIYGVETEFGVTCTFHGQRRLSPDEVARYLFRRVVSWGRSSNVFLQDGAHDVDNEFGAWFLANQQMLAALNFANAKADKDGSPGPRYELSHAWGEGTHNPAQGGAIFPDTMRWLWKNDKSGK